MRYTLKEFRGALSEIAETHDISTIMDQLESEEDTNLDSEDEIYVFTSTSQASISSAEVSRTEFPLPTFTDPEDALHPLLLSQCNDTCELGNISTAINSPPIASANNPPSPGPFLYQPSNLRTRSWRTQTRALFAKLGNSKHRV